MADAAGEETAAVLLRLLPPDAAELLLGRLPAEAAQRVRAHLADPLPPGPEVDAAMAQFFDLMRIADRAAPPAAGAAANEVPTAEPAGPVDELRTLPPDRLARALEGEQPSAVALILSCLDPAAAGQVMRRMPANLRADIAVRLTRPPVRNPALLDRLARVVAEKGRKLADVPVTPTEAERASAVADMIRALAQPDRGPIVTRLEAADAEFAAAVREHLYRVEDLLRVPDRQLQTLLSELEVRRLALAMHGVDPAIRAKVTANMSSRAKAALTEEMELLGSVPPSAIREAQLELLAVVRRLEEEGRIVIEE